MKKTPDIVNLVADPYPPYQYNESGTVRGIDHDIITAVFREFKIETRVQLFPWKDCITLIENKKADGIFQIVLTPERESVFSFSRPLRTAGTALYCTAGTSVEFDSERDIKVQLEGYTLGALAGYSYNPVIDSLKEPSKKEVDTQEKLLKGLLDGRFDLVVMDTGVEAYLVDKMKVDSIVRVRGFEITRELHVAFQKNLIELKDLFNSGLDKIKEKGIYKQIFHKYGL